MYPDLSGNVIMTLYFIEIYQLHVIPKLRIVCHWMVCNRLVCSMQHSMTAITQWIYIKIN